MPTLTAPKAKKPILTLEQTRRVSDAVRQVQWDVESETNEGTEKRAVAIGPHGLTTQEEFNELIGQLTNLGYMIGEEDYQEQKVTILYW